MARRPPPGELSRMEQKDILAGKLADTFQGPNFASFWTTKRITGGGWEFTDEISDNERKTLKITLKPGELPSVGDKGNPRERAEISEIRDISVPPESKATYSFRFYIPTGFAIENDNVIIAQWKQRVVNKEHPIISLRCYGDNMLKLVIVEGSDAEHITKHKLEIPCAPDTWHDVVITYQFNKDRTGMCSIKLDNGEAHTYAGHLGYDHLPQEGMYYKMGIYRPASDKQQSIYFSDFKRQVDKSEDP